MKQVKNNNAINEVVALNDEMLDQVNGGVLAEAAVIVVGTAIVACYVAKIVKLCKLRKVWAEEKRQRRAQKAEEAAAATAA